MVERGIIGEEDKEIYQFGIKNGFIILLNILTAFFIGLFTTKIVLVAVFTLSFMTLRSFTGGYHSESRIFCYISSSLVLFIPIYTTAVFEAMSIFVMLIALIAAAFIIVILSPMNSRHRELDQAEKKHFGFRAKGILLIQLVAFGILYGAGEYELSYAVYSSICLIAIFMLVGKICLAIQLNMEE